ncbi:UNVERIFIED_CONTAM: hypothetical protein FKN15_025348 [Acipenser sinensis]
MSRSANGLVEANPQYFVDSWKFRSSCPNLPPPNPSELEGSVGNCSFIESSFPDCVLVMNVDRYRQDCERSVFNPMSAVLPSCVIANDFTRHCAWTGMAVNYAECVPVRRVRCRVSKLTNVKGAVSGMCGDADGSTRKESAVSALDFGKMNLLTECTIPPAPSTTEEHTKYIESRCSILRSKEFGLCHAEVSEPEIIQNRQ